MNDQPMPMNGVGAGEVPSGARPEQLPVVPGSVGGEAASRPEMAPAAAEQGPSPAAQPAGAPPPKFSVADAAAAVAAVPGGGTPPANSGVGSSGLPVPTKADDADLIEPEWVNKAEEQIQKTAGDPYQEEEAIEGLQQEYLQKRYGLSVGDADKSSDKPGGA